MIVGDIPLRELMRRLRDGGIHLDTGAFTTRLEIAVPRIAAEFAQLYAPYPIEEPAGIDDLSVRVDYVSRLRWLRRGEVAAFTENDAIGPVPVERGFTAMETALNWGAALSEVAPMVMHSAVVERDGRAVIFPAPSGSGKSTLAAALAWRGWRLLSDEMAVFSYEDGSIYPNPRPVSLKNAAIATMQAFEPRARFTATYRDTPKGDVAYMQPPIDAIERMNVRAAPSLVIAVQWEHGVKAQVSPMERSEAFRWLVDSTVNYASMLRHGFRIMTAVVEKCHCYSLRYSDIDSAIRLVNDLHEAAVPLCASA